MFGLGLLYLSFCDHFYSIYFIWQGVVWIQNKPENQDEDALVGKIEQQQDFVILELGASIKVGVNL